MRRDLCYNSTSSAGAAAIFVWDFLLTIHLEVEYMWPAQWNFVKILFILTRYLPFVDLTLVLFYEMNPSTSTRACNILYSVAGWFIVMGIVIAEVILVLRTWTIWGRGKRIGYVLVTVSIVCLVPVLVIQKIFLDSIVFPPNPGRETLGLGFLLSSPFFPELTGLKMHANPHRLHRGFKFHCGNSVRDIRDHSHGGEGSSTIVAGSRKVAAVLYRDGVLFFCYLFGVSLINLIVIVTSPSHLAPANLLATFQRVMHSCLSARVLLNLRQAHRDELESPSNAESGPLRHPTYSQTEVSQDVEASYFTTLQDQVIEIS
ncbi:hypothetical protein NLI96_g7066 [Meripilus lineatus]|uniref:DUF6533 domain-containing protein n=1 Tax=Meripilus lineatus TaxID=2056292 RepID=A0AAD5V1L8_9APHY|nr:hypothetical protein NLI96_g7066 [Physisporinus lineatus]